MKREIVLTHEFVDYLPAELKEGTIYVSVAFATAAHTCCCGCGNQVITPLSPTDWKLIFDGESISLEPSIGNWNFACQSHYWIRRNRVKWAPRWTQAEIKVGRSHDALRKEQYYNSTNDPVNNDETSGAEESKCRESIWQRLRKWLF